MNSYTATDTPDQSGQHSVNFLRQTKILFVKNWLSKRRTEPKKLLGEICLPVFYLVILSFLVRLEPRKIYEEDLEEYRSPQNILNNLKDNNDNIIHVVHSSTKYAENVTNLMEFVWTNTMGTSRKLEFKFYSNLSDLMEAYMDTANIVKMAIILSENETFSYTIRINPDQYFQIPLPSNKKVGLETCRNRDKLEPGPESAITCPANGYYYTSFLAIQYLVDQALILQSTGKKDGLISLSIENYPKAAYTAGMSTFLRVIIPLYCIIPLAQLINTLLVLIVTEKENKIKDALKMIGVSDLSYWCSWFAIYGLMATIFAVMFTIVMHYMNVLSNINPVILFLLFLFFGFSIITFAFALTPFFHKPKTAGLVGTLIMQFTGMLFMLQTFLFKSSSGLLIPLRLISSVAFTTALDDACTYEHEGGISLSDLVPGERGAGVLYSLILLIFDTFLYGVLALYLDNVIPNEYGIRKNPLFFCNPSFWLGKKKTELEDDSINHIDTIGELENDDVEKANPSLIGKESIRIRSLKKTYGSWPNTKVVEALKGVSLDIYEGQITAILGRNGAGKSTLVNMMTGLVAPTSGRCVVFGLDISDPYDMARLRKMTGVCMQQDLHFKALTSQEHLEFYGRLRGINEEELQAEITTLLNELQLTDQRNVMSSKLSGGQKRKLSVGIALIGSPKIILLDEPSAGVDPVSRRHLWSLLQKKKDGRVILLTTHFMDEADILSDRKAIIHDGKLKCVGSSLFLKNRFGVGYYLTVEMDERGPKIGESDAIVQKWIPGALKSRKVIANEIKYALPHAEIQRFSNMFGDFEHLIQSGCSSIKSYGVSMTTLEEVFLKISQDDDISIDNNTVNVMPHRRMSTDSYRSTSGDNIDMFTDQPNNANLDEQNLIPNIGETKPNLLSIFWAICLLRIRRLIRNKQSLFFMVFMPVIMVAIGFALVKTQNIAVNEVKLSFSASQDSLEIYSSSDLNFAISEDSDLQLKSFINTTKMKAIPYSGEFADLLKLNKDHGTIAAILLNSTIPQYNTISINGTYLHVPGLVLNLISQYFLKWSYPNSTVPQIVTTNQPFPSKTVRVIDATTFYAVFLIGPAFTFAAVGMVMEVVRDREIMARNHLRVNGLSFGMYFASIFTVFGILSLLVTIMEVIVIFCFSVASFTNPYAITVVVFLLILFILPCLLFSAAFSYLFDRMESAQSVFSQICSWSGTVTAIAIILVDAFAPDNSLTVHIVFSALDIFYIPFGIFYWTNKVYYKCTILETCDELSFKSYMGPEFVSMAICMLIQIPVFTIILLMADVAKNGGNALSVLHILDNNGRPTSCSRVASSADSDMDNLNEDEDVKKEKTRVAEYFSDDHPNEKCVVAVKDLHKSYKRKQEKNNALGRKTYQKKVLHGIDLLVEEGEVFGLLGHNGAGKTSTMKIIIAEETPNSGKVKLCGQDIQSNLSNAFSKLGFCPQHDALWDNITLREHMELYAIIRGVQPHMQTKLINHFLKGLQITEHSEKKAKKLSGGTKRKLSYCMSMLGAPKLVLLDEPSTGMDVMSKRFLWNTVLGTFKENRGAILTTHSMEEADALCNRIGIMVKGSILCIGSPQHLKSKFGAGYTLEIKLKIRENFIVESTFNNFDHHAVEIEPSSDSSYAEKFKFVVQHFPDSKLNEMFGNRAVYSIPNSSVRSISQTFALLETLKEEHNVEEYSFSQTTLEQVFLQFAKVNEDEEEGEETT